MPEVGLPIAGLNLGESTLESDSAGIATPGSDK
jgi:hypothetical protein